MLKSRFLLIFIVLQLVFSSAYCRSINNYNVFWSKTVIRESFAEKFSAELDFVLRRQSLTPTSLNLFKYGLRQSIRPWLHWYPNHRFIFSISPIADFSTRPFIIDPTEIDHTSTGEVRNTLMTQYNHSISLTKITHRIRFERRDRELAFSAERAINYRIRYRLNLRYPQANRLISAHQWYVRFYNETIVQWGDQLEGVQFNQGRVFAGVGYSFPSFYRMELGYINQTRLSVDRSFYDVSQGIMLYLYFDRFFDTLKGKRGPAKI